MTEIRARILVGCNKDGFFHSPFIGDPVVKVASPLRPHSLHIHPSQPVGLGSSLCVTPHHRMASYESIGSCSLDADATASDASEILKPVLAAWLSVKQYHRRARSQTTGSQVMSRTPVHPVAASGPSWPRATSLDHLNHSRSLTRHPKWVEILSNQRVSVELSIMGFLFVPLLSGKESMDGIQSVDSVQKMSVSRSSKHLSLRAMWRYLAESWYHSLSQLLDYLLHPCLLFLPDWSLSTEKHCPKLHECVDGVSVSERTLHSLPLSTKTPEVEAINLCSLPCNVSSGGASTPEYVKRTAQLFETSSSESRLTSKKSSPKHGDCTRVNGETEKTDDIPSLVVVNGGEELLNGGESLGKKPSYLGLACSISGYSGITTYDSKLREGFRSRDHSPGRIGLVRSREVSPLRIGFDKTDNISAPELCYKSNCGNYLELPLRSSTLVNEKHSSISLGFVEKIGDRLASDLLMDRGGAYVNGGNKSYVINAEQLHPISKENTKKMSGISEKVGLANGSNFSNGLKDVNPQDFTEENQRHINNKTVTESCDTIAHESLSNTVSSIKESSRSFMSSMLSSNSYSTTCYESTLLNSKDRVGAKKPSKPSPAAKDQERYGSIPSSTKCSPDSPKTGSKDSLGAPMSSPLKRSPGAVRVIEFTSHAKSYIQTVSSHSTFSSSNSESMPSVSLLNHTGSKLGTSQQSSSSETLLNSVWSTNGGVNKSFIQQRVERLYGPGALAQGFFRRTKVHLKDEEDKMDSSEPPTAIRGSGSSPALPVLRHLRPEFRAQLSLSTIAKRQQLDTKSQEPQAEDVPLQTAKSSHEIPELQQQVSVESLPDLQPAAPEVVLPIDQTQVSITQPEPVSCSENILPLSLQEKDGHFYLKLLKQEIDKLNDLVASIEPDLAHEESLPEEALGKLRSASGQARLLVRQKLQQFEGLCQKNITRSQDEQFPTTSEDLAGFWDMVMLQVDHVYAMFEELNRLRSNNWQEDEAPPKDLTDGSAKRSVKRTNLKSPATSAETRKANEVARKVREDARRKLMEQRRKAMRDKTATDSVEIFVPHENGK
uniref:Disks large-associated protein 4 n=1 Tax=Timema poppense TaxID=170557 RepID=A0A7R9CTQ1_TIMPO|nr:unnamed protein product [Timema poppensis]